MVRHGESEPAIEGSDFPMVGGHGDPGLSEEGLRQADRVCARLAFEKIHDVVVTPLRRTVQTARPLLERLGIEPSVELDLREVHLGDWEGGLFRQKVLEGDPVALRMYEEERYEVIPGAEPAGVFSARVRAGVERTVALRPDKRVAVFTHGGVIGEILAQATRSRPFAFSGTDNASISHLVVTAEGQWVLRRFNDTTHLQLGLTLLADPVL